MVETTDSVITSTTSTHSLYMVLFIGEVRHGINPGVLKRSMADNFNVSIARIDKLFTGRPEIIKNNINKELADKYSKVLKELGAVSWIETMPPFYGKYIDRRKNNRTRRSSVAKNEKRIGKRSSGSDRRSRSGRRYHDK